MVVSVLLGGLVVGWLIDGFLKEGLHSQLWETPMWLGNRLQLPPRISAHVLAGSHRARNFRGWWSQKGRVKILIRESQKERKKIANTWLAHPGPELGEMWLIHNSHSLPLQELGSCL